MQHPAPGVDNGTDPGGRRADDRHAFLGGAEAGLGQVLRRAPGTEPGVVGRVEDEVGPVAAVDDFAGEDDFVAQLEADLSPAGQADGCLLYTSDAADEL